MKQQHYSSFSWREKLSWLFKNKEEKQLFLQYKIFSSKNNSLHTLKYFETTYPYLFEHVFYSALLQISLFKYYPQVSSYLLHNMFKQETIIITLPPRWQISKILDQLLTNGLYQKNPAIWSALFVTHTSNQLINLDKEINNEQIRIMEDVSILFFSHPQIRQLFSTIENRNLLFEHSNQNVYPFIHSIFLQIDLNNKFQQPRKKVIKI